jgi:hypothetical protein
MNSGLENRKPRCWRLEPRYSVKMSRSTHGRRSLAKILVAQESERSRSTSGSGTSKSGVGQQARSACSAPGRRGV